MQRCILAAFAIATLLSAAVLWHWWPEAENTWGWCWRAGAIFAAAWLAYDDVQRLPSWLLLLLPVLVIVMVRWSRLFLMLLPLLILGLVLRRFLWPGPDNRRK